MKKVILILIVIGALISCNDNQNSVGKPYKDRKYVEYNSGLMILAIDSCEYVVYQGPNSGDCAMVHSGNCHNPKHQKAAP